VSKTLKDAEDILCDFGFIRIHHSHLINPNHIDKYVKGDGGYLQMKDGSQLTISRPNKEKFNELFSKI
jgi:two-component system LytT family response regulator